MVRGSFFSNQGRWQGQRTGPRDHAGRGLRTGAGKRVVMRAARVETVGVTSTGPVRGAPRHAGQADRPPFPRTKAYMRDDGPLVPPETLHGGPTWGLDPADPPHLSLNTLWAVSTGRSVHGPGPRACSKQPLASAPGAPIWPADYPPPLLTLCDGSGLASSADHPPSCNPRGAQRPSR